MQKKRITILLVILIGLPLLALGILLLGISLRFKMHTFPTPVEAYDISQYDFPIIECLIPREEKGDDYAWFLSLDGDLQKPLLIFLHGAAGNISSSLYVDSYKTLLDLGVNLLVCEYPGTGITPGADDTDTCLDMIKRAISYGINRLGVSRSRIVLYGVSMGSYFALKTGLTDPDLPLILDSPVTSAGDFVRNFIKVPLPDFVFFVLPQYFNNHQLIRQLKNPLFILHGKKDHIVSPGDVQKLFDGCSAPIKMIYSYEGGHIFSWNWNKVNREKIEKKFRTFFALIK